MPHAFEPLAVRTLSLRNRLVRAGCYEGMARKGLVTDELIAHHRAIAAGGMGMTTVAYCAVSPEGRAFADELLMRPEIMPGLRRITEAIHGQGAAASIQLVHCGFFADPKVIRTRPMGASAKYCSFRMARCREMTEADIQATVDAFGRAAAMAREAGFDAVEVHAGHGYLLSQFLSPWTNHRSDRYGGSPAARQAFPCEVVRRVRETGIVTVVKMNLEDGFPGGLTLEGAASAAQAFGKAGADMIVPSGGFTARTPFYMMRGRMPVAEMAANQRNLFTRLALLAFGRMLPRHTFTPLFFLEQARHIVRAVNVPVAYVGGTLGAADIARVLDDGFALVQVGRATIRHPDFARRLQSGAMQTSDCDHCNRCVAAMDGGGVWCVSEKKGLLTTQ